MSASYFSLSGLGLGLAAPDGVIARPDGAQLDEADLILRRARDEAERIGREAQAAFEAEKARGHAEGLAAAGREAAERMLDDQRRLATALDALEGQIADLVQASVQQILRGFDSETLAFETVRSALAAMRSEKRAQLHVAPSAYETIRRRMDEILADYPEIELVDVITDPGLTAPDLRLESSLGVVDFSLDHTLDDLGRLLKGG